MGPVGQAPQHPPHREPCWNSWEPGATQKLGTFTPWNPGSFIFQFAKNITFKNLSNAIMSTVSSRDTTTSELPLWLIYSPGTRRCCSSMVLNSGFGITCHCRWWGHEHLAVSKLPPCQKYDCFMLFAKNMNPSSSYSSPKCGEYSQPNTDVFQCQTFMISLHCTFPFHGKGVFCC